MTDLAESRSITEQRGAAGFLFGSKGRQTQSSRLRVHICYVVNSVLLVVTVLIEARSDPLRSLNASAD